MNFILFKQFEQCTIVDYTLKCNIIKVVGNTRVYILYCEFEVIVALY